jgi:hypothetical protein
MACPYKSQLDEQEIAGKTLCHSEGALGRHGDKNLGSSCSRHLVHVKAEPRFLKSRHYRYCGPFGMTNTSVFSVPSATSCKNLAMNHRDFRRARKTISEAMRIIRGYRILLIIAELANIPSRRYSLPET